MCEHGYDSKVQTLIPVNINEFIVHVYKDWKITFLFPYCQNLCCLVHSIKQ